MFLGHVSREDSLVCARELYLPSFITSHSGSTPITVPNLRSVPHLVNTESEVTPPEVADLAYVTVCIKTPDPQNNFGGYEYYDQCLASICSLLGTTNPKTVIVMVDEHFPDNARKALESQGVQLVLLRDKAYTVWPDSAKYPAERFANHPRLHTFQKLAIFNMTQFKNVFWLDSDVEVKTNLTAYFETLPKDRDAVLTPVHRNKCNLAFNSGVMVIRPSAHVFKALLEIWRSGRFSFNFGAASHDCDVSTRQDSLSEQDLLIEYFAREKGRASYHELSTCYNYRGSLSQQQTCGPRGTEKVLHIAKLLKWADMSAWQIHSWRGTCRDHPTYPATRRKGAI